ncbi:MAG: LysR family transcriptional regulator [Acutalibacteraceae bacterium]
MDTFSYRVFLTIVKYNSFQKAAELHSVTPPAISHIVKQLEQEFGFLLFIRNRRGVSLTASGESVLQAISDIVKKEDVLYQLLSELNGLERGHVRLGIFNSMCKYLPDLIRSFGEQYPQISFEIYQGSYEDIIEWLKTGVVDIGFLSKTVNPGFLFYEIFSDPLMCILKKGTKTPADDEIFLESLADSHFVMQRESCDADARRIMDKMNLDVRTICHVVDDKTTVEMVKAGFGFAIMPLMTMYGFEDEVKMLPIVPAEKRVIGVAVRDANDLSPAVKKAFEFIRNYHFEE